MTSQGGKRSFAVNIANRSSGHKFCVMVAIFVLLVAAASTITSQQQNEYSNLLNSSYLHNKNFVDHTSSNCKLSMSGTSGKCTTKDLEVAFALIGRDVAHELPYIFNNIMRLTPKFKRSHIIFVENDSGDGTVEAFWSWANSTQVKNVFQTANLISLSPGARGKKDLGVLAEARNAYLDYLKSEEFNSLDFMIPVVRFQYCGGFALHHWRNDHV